MTIHDYVQRRQFDPKPQNFWRFQIDRLLKSPLSAGYESQQAFSSAFKSMYKIPPAEYRDNREFYPLQLRICFAQKCGKQGVCKG